MTTDLTTGRSRGLSLKTTLAAVVATLAILVLIACGIAGLEAWRGYVGAGRVAEVNANTDLLLKGLKAFSSSAARPIRLFKRQLRSPPRSRKSLPSAGVTGIHRCRKPWTDLLRAGSPAATG